MVIQMDGRFEVDDDPVPLSVQSLHQMILPRKTFSRYIQLLNKCPQNALNNVRNNSQSYV